MWSAKGLPLLLRKARDTSKSHHVLIGAAASLLAIAAIDHEVTRRRRQDDPDDTEQTHAVPSLHHLSPQTVLSTSCEAAQIMMNRPSLNRSSTIRKMDEQSSRESVTEKYDVDWDKPLGEGAFGSVYLATNKQTGEQVALKKISKRYTDNTAFQREMNALFHLKKAGGHPNICSLHEHFDEGGYYYVILDLVMGGEMFDHLVSNGAFSEADAARLVREVASALAFIHGMDTTHGDMKPENLMLSTKNPSDAVIKLVDFGCAQVTAEDSFFASTESNDAMTGRTPAYCPPEVLDKRRRQSKMDPSMDMWALGVILYIMLTGLHPYDLTGNSTDEAIEKRVVSKKMPPLRNSPITAHLSDSAIDLIEKLMKPGARWRLTALEMLDHPWVKGETASTSKMAGSDKKLSSYRKFKSRLEAKVFADIVKWSDEGNANDDISRKTSLIERSFRSFDPQQKGYITEKDLQKDLSPSDSNDSGEEEFEKPSPLSLSGFSDLLSENMKNRYFPKGHTIYREGDPGHSMYFINSGIIEVVTKDGARVNRGPGNFFGEGALLHPKQIRSATIRCKTPVHAMEISREYFEKYLSTSDSGILLAIKEKDKIRKRNRAKTILRLQKNLVERDFNKGERLFTDGESGDSLFLVESGDVDIIVNRKKVLTVLPGNMCGEFSVMHGAPRNCTAVCVSKDGCITQEMKGDDFRKLMEESPDMQESIRDLCARREFKKAVVKRLRKEFPYDNPRKAFDAVRAGRCKDDNLDVDAIASLMRELNPKYSDEEILEIVNRLDLSNSGSVSFDEFKKVFIADIRTAAAM